jgi:osmotically-inducible protein OsmY
VAADVRKQIESALRRTAALEGRGIEVKVSGNEVVLEGTVKSWHDREVAEQAAWASAGVTSVRDHLTVG